MKKVTLVLGIVGLAVPSSAVDLASLVNPFVGTVREGFAHPGATWPGGMLHDVLMLPFTGDLPKSTSAMEEVHLVGKMDKAMMQS